MLPRATPIFTFFAFIFVAVMPSAEAADLPTIKDFFARFHENASAPIVAYCAAEVPSLAAPLGEAVEIYKRNAAIASAGLAARIADRGEEKISAEMERLPSDSAARAIKLVKDAGNAKSYCAALVTRLKAQTPETLQKSIVDAFARYEDLAKKKTEADKPEEKEAVELPQVIPENLTSLGMAMWAGEDSFGDYYSITTKISFEYKADGSMQRAEKSEPVISGADDAARDRDCTEKGGGFNQRTTWFPDTAIFVHGGTLASVSAGGGALTLHALTKRADGSMIYDGKGARKVEYAFVPCVGRQRAKQGHRLNGFLPRDAVVNVLDAKNKPIKLTLPQPNEPYLLLRYHAGAMIPVPMRAVVVSVDMVAQRLTVQYQSTFPQEPPLRKVELRAVFASDGAHEGETEARFKERTAATLQDLQQCATPTKPMEPCATPTRSPNLLIFGERRK